MSDELTFDDESSGSDDPIAKTEALLRLVGELFKRFCADMHVPLEHAGQTNPISFLQWADELTTTTNTEEATAICAQAGVTMSSWEHLIALAVDPTGPNQLAGVWPQVTLAFRGKPRSRLESVHTVILLKWDDGRVAPLSSFVPAELCSNNGVFTDGNVCSLIQATAHNLMEIVCNISLDVLHDQKSSAADDQAYEILMGLLIKILQGAPIIDPVTGESVKLAEHFKPRCQDVMRVLQSMFRPPVPQEVKEQIGRIRAKQQQSPNSKPTGGWDG